MKQQILTVVFLVFANNQTYPELLSITEDDDGHPVAEETETMCDTDSRPRRVRKKPNRFIDESGQQLYQNGCSISNNIAS